MSVYSTTPANASFSVEDFHGGLGRISRNLPTIFLMGALRSGKTSIERVVFHKMEPHQTLYNVQSTREVRMTLIQYNPLVQFQIVDFPGSFDCSDPDVRPSEIFAYCSVLVFVVDAQDRPYTDALKYVVTTIETAHSVNKNIQFFLLIHKVDVETFFSNENKFRTRHDIQFKIFEQLAEINLGDLVVDYELTSIYDQTIFEALSKVVKQLIPKDVLSFLETTLSTLVNKCDIEKAYIFDVPSKLYIAKDSSPIDFEAISLCSDMIDIVMDLSGIYGGYQSALPSTSSGSNTTTSPGTIANSSVISAASHHSGFDEESDAFITLQSGPNNQILMLREVGQYLALVCLMKKPGNKGLLEYNFKIFRNQVQKLLKINEEFQKKSRMKFTGTSTTGPYSYSSSEGETESKLSHNGHDTLNMSSTTTGLKSPTTMQTFDNYWKHGSDKEDFLLMDDNHTLNTNLNTNPNTNLNINTTNSSTGKSDKEAIPNVTSAVTRGGEERSKAPNL